MPRDSAAQTVLPFGDQPEEVLHSDPQDVAAGWDQVLQAAFADPHRHSGFLPQAEEAVRAQPGDGHLLLLAATAALFDQDPARAQVFLKRFSKRYVAIGTCHAVVRKVSSEDPGVACHMLAPPPNLESPS